MGKSRVITKDISNQEAVERVIRALQSGSLTFAQVQAMGLGVLPMGDYKGYAANWDIDLAVKQPLILAEQLNTLGILHGLKEDRDLKTIIIAAGSAIGTVGVGQITVPAGEVWFINTIRTTLPALNGGYPTFNWHSSLWADPATTPSSYGQPFHPAALDYGVGGGIHYDEFNFVGQLWAVNNKNWPLRLPGGTVLTFVCTNTTGAVAAGGITTTVELFGWVGKPLVD